MKKIVVFICFILSAILSFAFEAKKVAILEVEDKDGSLSTSQKLILRTKLAEVVSNTSGFEAYNRTDLDAILHEHNFQRSGFVNKDQIRELGNMAGVSYILLPEGVLTDDSRIFIIAQLIDVETGKVEFTTNELVGTSTSEMNKGCESLAKKIFSKLTNSANLSIIEEDAEKAKYYINNHKGEYIYLENVMNKKEYVNFLKNNCPEAFRLHKDGKKIITSGWCLFGIGLGFITTGGMYQLAVELNHYGSKDDKYHDFYSQVQRTKLDIQYNNYSVISLSIVCIGAGITAISIPLLSVGYAKQKKALTTYNKQCSSPYISPLTLNLTAGQNGLGLALNF